jgi:choline dehydrogenase
VEAIIDGVELVADLLSSPPLVEALELLPDSKPAWGGRDHLGAWLRKRVGTMFHPSGTCRMAPAADALGVVVDEVGRVRGLTNLRVADASIFPTIPRATVHFAVVAVAEKLADALATGER